MPRKHKYPPVSIEDVLSKPTRYRPFVTVDQFHEGQRTAYHSKKRVIGITAGQGGGKTSLQYHWLKKKLQESKGGAVIYAFPTLTLLDRVLLTPVDPDRPTFLEFLEAEGGEPVLHKTEQWIGTKWGTVLFGSAEALTNLEGSHVFGACLDEFDEAPRELFNRLLERTRQARGQVMIGGTPRHCRWIGDVINEMGKQLDLITFASTDNPWYSPEAMEEARATMPDWLFDRMHLGLLTAAEGGNLFKKEWLQYGAIATPIETIQFWDTASTTKTRSDYSVCGTFTRTSRGIHLINIFRDKLEYPQLLTRAVQLYQQYRPRLIMIERKSNGEALLPDLQLKGLPAHGLPAEIKDKFSRAMGVTNLVYRGHLWLPDVAHAWHKDFIDELIRFPSVTHDDQVDVLLHALKYFKPYLETLGYSRVSHGRKDGYGVADAIGDGAAEPWWDGARQCWRSDRINLPVGTKAPERGQSTIISGKAERGSGILRRINGR